jgi:gas vesicle protein
MLSSRMMAGALIGGALVYFFDPDKGPERRAHLRSLWMENREPIMETARTTAAAAQEKAAQSAGQASQKVTELRSRVRGEESTSNTSPSGVASPTT